MSKTTFDLSTLSDIADGTHTVKVKAKADGYRDSECSNEVSYTKAPAGYKLTITGSWYNEASPRGGGYLSFNGLDSEGRLIYPQYLSTGSNESYVTYHESLSSSEKKACPLVFENVSKIAIYGFITINGTTNQYRNNTEYVLTQDITVSLGYQDFAD